MDNVRLIDAKATHEKLIQHAMECAACGKLKEAADCVVAAGVLMDETLVQTVDAEPVRYGRWVLVGADKRGRGGVFQCTACNGCHPHKSARCSNCGAKMDAEVVEA